MKISKKDFDKLIVDFLGAKIVGNPILNEYDMYGIIPTINDGEDEQHCFTLGEMNFHSDWNWIMVVVEKIESLGYWINRVDGDYTVVDDENNVIINTPQSSGGIFMLFMLLIDFIKFYNKTTKVKEITYEDFEDIVIEENCEIDPMTNCFFYSTEDRVIYFTPYWEGSKGISVQISGDNIGDIFFGVPFPKKSLKSQRKYFRKFIRSVKKTFK